MVGKADEAVGVPTANLGEMLVIAAGDEADGSNAVAIQLLYPALGLNFVTGVIRRLLGQWKIPHASPMFSIGAGPFAQDCASLGTDRGFVVLHGVAHVGEPGAFGRKVGVKVDDFKILVHGENGSLYLAFVDHSQQWRKLTSETRTDYQITHSRATRVRVLTPEGFRRLMLHHFPLLVHLLRYSNLRVPKYWCLV